MSQIDEKKYEAVYRLFEAAERFRYTPKCSVGHEEEGDLPSWCPDCQKIEQAGEELFEIIEEELGAKTRSVVPNP
jgi:thiol-disulfide isomerase/thioredoxin